MPLTRCQSKGKQGWKAGKTGKCYTDKQAKKKAIKQELAIARSQKREPHL